MLTIKWITRTAAGSKERVYPVDAVEVAYKNDSFPKERLELDGRDVDNALVVAHSNGCTYSFDCGMIYVMNEQGSTVARYQLTDDDTAVALEVKTKGLVVAS